VFISADLRNDSLIKPNYPQSTERRRFAVDRILAPEIFEYFWLAYAASQWQIVLECERMGQKNMRSEKQMRKSVIYMAFDVTKVSRNTLKAEEAAIRYGWHSLPANRRLLHGDQRQVEIGVPTIWEGELILYSPSLHASPTPRTMLSNINGPVLCYVKCEGIGARCDDMFVSRSRTVLWWADCTDMLREFACWSALSVSHLWEMPDTVRRYLDGTDRSDSAGVVAGDAICGAVDGSVAMIVATARARGAAWFATRDPVDSAASMAAESAVSAAAWDIGGSVANTADWSAARDAALDAQNTKLLEMLSSLGWKEVTP